MIQNSNEWSSSLSQKKLIKKKLVPKKGDQKITTYKKGDQKNYNL